MSEPIAVPARAGRPEAIWRLPGMWQLILVTVTGFGGFAVLFPVVPLWVVRGGQDAAGAGLVNGVLLLATIATQPFVPRALERFGVGRSLSIALLSLALPALAFGLSDSLTLTLALSTLRGIGFGIFTVTGSTVVADLVAPARRGEAIGFYGLGIAVPNLVLLPVSVAVAERFGFWTVFAIGALPLLGIPAAFKLGRVLAAGRLRADHEQMPVATTWWQTRSALAPALVLFAVTMSGGALMTFLPQMTDSSGVAVTALLLLGLVAAVGRWRIGRIADRGGAHRLLLPLLLVTVVGIVLTAVAVGPESTRPWLLFVAVAVVGAGYGTLQNLTLLVALSGVKRGEHGRASAIWNVGFDSGTALGAVLLGLLATGSSFSAGLFVLAGLTLFAVPLTLLRTRRA